MVSLTAKVMFFSLLLLAVALEVAGDVLFKRWAMENKTLLLIVGLVVYSAGTAMWAFSLKYEYLSRAISIFTVINLIAVVAVGVVVFKEELSLLHKVGIGLGALSVVLMEW